MRFVAARGNFLPSSTRLFSVVRASSRLDNWIGGILTPPIHFEYIENINPFNREIINLIPRSKHDDVDNAVSRALDSSKTWAAYSVQERAAIMIRIAEEIEGNIHEFALAETLDTGKPLNLSTNLDISRSAHNFRFFAENLLSKKDEVYEQVKL